MKRLPLPKKPSQPELTLSEIAVGPVCPLNQTAPEKKTGILSGGAMTSAFMSAFL